MAFFEVCKNLGRLCVHQVKIKVIDAAQPQLTFKKLADLGFRFEIGIGQFVGQRKAVPRVTCDQAVAQGGFALPVRVAVRRVKVIETAVGKGIDHFVEFCGIHFLALHGQTHAAETEILFDFSESKHIVASPKNFGLLQALPRNSDGAIAPTRIAR